MKIGESQPISGPGGTRREERAARSYARAASQTGSAPTDTATVMAIPEAELTPKVRDAIMALMQEVATLRRELEAAQSRLAQVEKLADQDLLAPIPNRRAFVRELNRVASYSQRYGSASSLIYFDLNEFKAINDKYGHAAGDAALLHVAQTLVRNVRESDIVGRLGGDEFGVILANADGRVAHAKAAALAAAIEAEAVSHGEHRFAVSVAYGATTFDGAHSVSDAMAAADRAMYEFKLASKAQS